MSLVAEVAQVAEIHIRAWKYSNSTLNTIFHNQIFFQSLLSSFFEATHAVMCISFTCATSLSMTVSAKNSVDALQIDIQVNSCL